MDMTSKNSSKDKAVGVVGMGSFGTAIANILSEKSKVIAFVRRAEVMMKSTKTTRWMA